jgi:hypothetical protein
VIFDHDVGTQERFEGSEGGAFGARFAEDDRGQQLFAAFAYQGDSASAVGRGDDKFCWHNDSSHELRFLTSRIGLNPK